MPAKTKIQRDNQENPGSGGKKNPICPPKQKITKNYPTYRIFYCYYPKIGI